MKCVYCGSNLEQEQLFKDVGSQPEISVTSFKHEDYIVLALSPLAEDYAYRLFHFSISNGTVPKEQHLYTSKAQARIVLFENDTLLILAVRHGFPAVFLQYRDGILDAKQLNQEQINVTFNTTDSD